MEGRRAVGVSFVREGGEVHSVFANKEVIVSASAINSPHLLMLSGIGPKAELEKHRVRFNWSIDHHVICPVLISLWVIGGC